MNAFKTNFAKALLMLVALMPSGPAWSVWPAGFGGPGDDTGRVVQVGSSGDVFVAGNFSNSLALGGTTLYSGGGQDFYVARLSSGGALIWAVRFGNAGTDNLVDMALDPAENIYLTGEFSGSMQAGGNQISSNNGSVDVFVLKLDATGAVQWLTGAGGPNHDRVGGIGRIPGDQNQLPPTPDQLVLAGTFDTSMDIPASLNGNPTSIATTSGEGGWLAGLNADGNWAWIKEGDTSRLERFTDIVVAADGRTFITGFAEGSPVPVWSENFDDVSRYDPDGVYNNNTIYEPDDPRDTLPLTWSADTGAIGNSAGGTYWHLQPGTGCTFASSPPPATVDGITGATTITPGRCSYSLFMAGRNSGQAIYSEVVDTSNANRLKLSLKLWEGQDYFSEDTDHGEDFEVSYRDANGNWQRIIYEYGGGSRTNRSFSFYLPNDARHSAFQLRFRMMAGSGAGYDFWHVDDIVLQDASLVPFVAEVLNLASGDAAQIVASSASPANRIDLPASFTPAQLAYYDGTADANPNPVLFVLGDHAGGVLSLQAYSDGQVTDPTGTALLALQPNESTVFSPVGLYTYPGINMRNLALDSSGNLYLAGDFSGTISLDSGGGTTTSLSSQNGSSDLLVLSYTSTLNFRWVTGGDGNTAGGALPGMAGGALDDQASDIAYDGINNLFLLGDFRDLAVFGDDEQVISAGGTDVFLASLDVNGAWFDVQNWTVGVPVPPPAGADVTSPSMGIFPPQVLVAGVEVTDAIGRLFYWQGPVGTTPAQLFPLQPVADVTLRWKTNDDPQDSSRVVSIGGSAWPAQRCSPVNGTGCYQIHVAGSPVEIEPADQSRVYLPANGLIIPDQQGSNASIDSGVFTATTPGFAVITYVVGNTPDITAYPVDFEVVRTVAYANAPEFEANVPAEIGKTLVEASHDEPGRTGYVLNERAFYDGAGDNPAYNRSARTGQIIPVNVLNPVRQQDAGKELVVAWYRRNSRQVFWPEKPVQYDAFWPLNPERIIIASQEGGEVLGQAPLDPQVYTNLTLYRQPDVNLPGFNPNEEHAFFAPSSTGSGVEAVFALRADFGSPVDEVDADSDPWVLVKYFDTVIGSWKFRVYRVEATGAGYSNFRFSGVAGTTVSPPYPLRLLSGCAETLVSGQSSNTDPVPPPFFQDYTNQLWSTSAGSGSVYYYYPVQPGFDGPVPGLQAGQCIPWMPALPSDQGGTADLSKPIEVAYDIGWPTETPQLLPGETLLAPKRGLPDIYNQAAVQVVYDEVQANGSRPSDTAAQLLDPLSPRKVELNAIPSTVATEFRTDGKEDILGNASGTLKLPIALRKRLSYDPINKRLIFQGLYDASGAGEPLLLLNVMSKQDRAALLELDDGNANPPTSGKSCAPGAGDNCSWDEAVQALFRLSRNPNGIRMVNDNGTLRAVNDDDVLVAWEEFNPAHPTGDGVLAPFRAVGVNAALSAGASQGNGYLTLAFNNDPSLTPAPISLSVIRVDCLDVNGDGSLLAPYQGQLQIITPDNVFDEQLTLRHSGDFGGLAETLEFEWYFKPDQDGTPPALLPDPDNGQMNGWFPFTLPSNQGAVEVVIQGANIVTLSDNWFVARYRGLPQCGNSSNWSLYAGQPGATPLDQRAQLAEGWVKRVLKRLNPFEARVQNFAQAATNNYASMLVQLGERWEGDIALNSDPDNLNSIGLIEAYQSVMNRAMALSVGATPPVNYGPANSAILLVTSRLVDFYTLLGNEAYADAQDPTIGITTTSNIYGFSSLAPTIFNFQNQLPDLLEEELALLRGRNDSFGPVAASPVYNRLFWNFTTGDGEVAYALSYNITDQNADGVIDEYDARILYPQGHGDAWGHYLTATTFYYNLLRHPFFTWEARPEGITVAGTPITVDFLDERQFVETAAAKARVGAEVVDLTYRSAYVEDPAGQWQGYKDTDPDRAWGVTGWARRAGMGAYFDWVTANAVIPAEDNDPSHEGIQIIQRDNIPQLGELVASAVKVQRKMDDADAGLNPLGLAKGVVPFDIDPSLVDAGQTHFEQVYERASTALQNVTQVWDFANQLNRMMRNSQNTVADINRDAQASERDYRNRLIEIFGYPYEDDIGAGGLYPADYDGPDLYHYMYIDAPQLAGTPFDVDANNVANNGDSPNAAFGALLPTEIQVITAVYKQSPSGLGFFGLGTADSVDCSLTPLVSTCPLGVPSTSETLEVKTNLASTPEFTSFVKPANWVGSRRAQGRLQEILQQMVQAQVDIKRAYREYDNLRKDLEDQVGTMQATYNLQESQVNVLDRKRTAEITIKSVASAMRATSFALKKGASSIEKVAKDANECLPKNLIFGLASGVDAFSSVRCAVVQSTWASKALKWTAQGLDLALEAKEDLVDGVGSVADRQVEILNQRMDMFNLYGELDKLIRKEPVLRAEVYQRTEALQQLQQQYYSTLAEGLRLFEELVAFRRQGAAQIQEYRYQDMAFRIFRNDALQKYRSAFDLAARYTYLAATAYDYETNLLGSDGQGGRQFLTDIVRQRSIGQILNGQPVPGSRGLADPMGRMKLNFDVLKGQMGFNNPQLEGNRFSLRQELFRISDDADGDARWRQVLTEHIVPDLWQLPEFRRYARPFAPESAGPQPGLVIPFDTTVSFGLNYFGWELGPGDSSYDPTQFSTRIRAAGIWFDNYDTSQLSQTPRVYLIPVGADVLRSPDAFNFSVRQWQVVDQAIPVPFPIGQQELTDANWNPTVDSLIGQTEIRRYSQFRAWPYDAVLDDSQFVTDSRLIGRSVWNRRWLLIIPAGNLLFDPNEGLDTFIHGAVIPGTNGQRDGNGVRDIRLYFKTYAYSGN